MQLQFEVFEYRLKNEYNSDIIKYPLDFSIARWVVDSNIDTVTSTLQSNHKLVFDSKNRPLILFPNQFNLDYYMQRNPEIRLVEALDVTD